MAQIRLEPPEAFNFRRSDDWPRWKQRFHQFRIASGLAAETAVKQVQTLLYCMGEEAEAVLSSTDITEDEKKVYDTVLDKMDGYFKVRKNVIFERARFNRRNQQDGESAEQYIMILYRLAENCNYDDLKEEMIRDRLVVGIKDAALSQQLQLDADLTLEKAKKKIRQREAVGQQQKELKETNEEAKVDELHSKRFSKGNRLQNRGRAGGYSRKTTPTKTCTRCGRGSHPKEKCPAKDAACHKCSKKGHYGSQCFTKSLAEVESKSALDTAFLGAITNNETPIWRVELSLNQQNVEFKLDTGAAVTAISQETYKYLRKHQLTSPRKVLYGPSRQPLKTLGHFMGKFTHQGNTITQSVYVADGLKTNLLGLPEIVALKLAVRVDTTETKCLPTMAENVKKRFPSIFQGLGNSNSPRSQSSSRIGTNGEARSNFKSQQTNSLVCRNGNSTKETRSNTHLRRLKTTQRECLS